MVISLGAVPLVVGRGRAGLTHPTGSLAGRLGLGRHLTVAGIGAAHPADRTTQELGLLVRLLEAIGTALGAVRTLAAARLSRLHRPVKILGDGKLAKALTVAAHKFSANAQAKIEAAGGRCEVIPR